MQTLTKSKKVWRQWYDEELPAAVAPTIKEALTGMSDWSSRL
jgi:hypothetical protein